MKRSNFLATILQNKKSKKKRDNPQNKTARITSQWISCIMNIFPRNIIKAKTTLSIIDKLKNPVLSNSNKYYIQNFC